MKSWHYIIKYAAIALAVLLVVGVLAGFMRLLSYFLPVLSSNTTREFKTFEIRNEINILKIEVHQVDLEILTAPNAVFRVESNCKDLTVLENENELFVKDKKRFFLSGNGDAVLRLFIPEGTVFDEVHISTGAGKTDLEDMRAKVIDMNFGAGKVVMQNVVATDNAFIDAGVGKLSIRKSQFNNLELDMGVGDLEFSGTLLGRNAFKLGVGSSQIDLTGSLDDYRIHVEKGIGTIYVDGDNVKNDTRLGQGDTELFCEGGVGTIKITFTE